MKKILAIALALVLALSLGVTAFADVYADGYAGGNYSKEEDDYTIDWIWDVFEDTKSEYCRIAVDFRYEDYVDIYVQPNYIGLQLLGEDKWDNFTFWDFDEDSFEVFAEGPFTYTVKEVTLTADAAVGKAKETFQLYYNGAYYDMYINATDDVYIYAKLDDHNYKMFYYIGNHQNWLEAVAETDNHVWMFTDAGEDAFDAMREDGTPGDASILDPKLVADEDLIKALKLYQYDVNIVDVDFYRIRITPVDDYGVKVIRGSIYFKMIDYTSGRTAKFTSAPLYIDFFHTDVYDDDVKDVAGEKKAMVLDWGEPYDNEFNCGKHDHEGGYTVDMPPMFVDGPYDYDAVYGYENQEPDVVSKEHFDEGVGKSLKITDLDYTWRLEMAKVAEYQPSVNFTFNSTVADVIKGAFPDAKFQAVNFLTPNDGVIYKTASKLYIKCDAKALAQKGEDTVYAYKYVGGVLEYQDAFEVNYYNTGDQYVYVELAAGESLGSYYLSDTDLRAAAPTEENPDTGANDVVGVAVALAVVSLVAAAAVSLKK